MNASGTSTNLVIGLAALGAGLLVAAVRMSRRPAPRHAHDRPKDPAGTASRPHPPVAREAASSNGAISVNGRATWADGKSLLAYFFFVFVLAIPFWLFGDRKLPLPFNLPLGALATFVPFAAAAVVAFRQQGSSGVRALLQKAVDYEKIKDGIWYLPALFLLPFIAVVAYTSMRVAGRPLPETVEISPLMVPVFFVMFYIGAAGEELGWTGFALEPLQQRWGALAAGLVLGIVWVIWHIILWVQTGNPASWILWQGVFSIALRILIVWLYNNAGKSVFAAILLHVTANLSWSLFPNYGSHYDPFVTSLLAWLTVVIVIFMWEPGTLARIRQATVRGMRAPVMGDHHDETP